MVLYLLKSNQVRRLPWTRLQLRVSRFVPCVARALTCPSRAVLPENSHWWELLSVPRTNALNRDTSTAVGALGDSRVCSGQKKSAAAVGRAVLPRSCDVARGLCRSQPRKAAGMDRVTPQETVDWQENGKLTIVDGNRSGLGNTACR